METIEDNKIQTGNDEQYWGIALYKLHNLEVKFDEIAKTNPDLGQDLLSMYEELMMFNIPICRHHNGIDFVLTTDTGRVVGSGKFIEPLKDVSMEGMDYHLSEEASQEEVDKALDNINVLADECIRR